MLFDFSKCTSLEHVARCAGVSEDMLTAMCSKAELHGADALRACMPPWSRVVLIRHKIPKRRPKVGGTHRVVFEPYPRPPMDAYRTLNRRLVTFFAGRIDGFPSRCAHGFVAGRNTKTNAEPHCGSLFLLRLDIADFFSAISHSRVCALFGSLGVVPKIADTLASALTYEGRLAEGLPTSPLIANVCAHPIDQGMESIVAASDDRTLRYTRYGDDISLSSRVRMPSLESVRLLVEINGFRVREDKTARSVPGQAHFVTGLSVNQQSPRVPKKLKRKLRLLTHYIDKRGLAKHAAHIKRTKESAANRAYGLLSYVQAIEPEVANRCRQKLLAAFQQAGAMPTYPGRAPILIHDVDLVVDESSMDGWVAVCVVEVPGMAHARQDITEHLATLAADPFTLDRQGRLETRGLHFVDNHPDVRSGWIERMSLMSLRAYVAYSRSKPSPDLYLRLLGRIMAAFRPWPKARSLTMHVEEGPIGSQEAEICNLVRNAVPEVGVSRPISVKVVTKKGEPATCLPDYFLGVLGKAIALRSAGDGGEQASRRFERLRDKYRMILDIDRNKWFSRVHPFLITEF